MIRIEHGRPARHDVAEAAARPRRHGKRVIAGLGFGIEKHVALADLRERVASLGQRHGNVRLGRKHPLGIDRLARLGHKIARDKVLRLDWRSVEGDRAKAVTGPRRSGEHDHQRPGSGLGKFDRAVDRCVVKAFADQQVGQKLLVLQHPRRDHRPVARLAIPVVERRKFLEPGPDRPSAIGAGIGTRSRCPERIQPFDTKAVAYRLRHAVVRLGIPVFVEGLDVEALDRAQRGIDLGFVGQARQHRIGGQRWIARGPRLRFKLSLFGIPILDRAQRGIRIDCRDGGIELLVVDDRRLSGTGSRLRWDTLIRRLHGLGGRAGT